MNPLTTFVRALGNDRALANARSTLDARLREERLVQQLLARIETTTSVPVPAPAETSTAA